MSDRPDTKSNDQTPNNGGWHQPKTPQLWKPVEKTPEPEPVAGWRVPALPQDLTESPQESGSWHLPRPEDTLFRAEDEIEVSPAAKAARQQESSTSLDAVRPEDLIAEIMGTSRSTGETPAVRPEDAVGDLQRTDVNQDGELDIMDDIDAVLDDDAFSFSEYQALRSLDEGSDATEEVDLSEFGEEDLSPAQLAAIQSATQALPFDSLTGEMPPAAPAQPIDGEADDAASIAARMAAQYADGGAGEGEAVADEAGVTGDDAASIAARMAAQYGDGSVEAPAPDMGTQPLDPALQELQGKFMATRDAVNILRGQYQAGQITYDDLQARLREHTILDNQNNWWMIGLETDKWYRFDNATNQWVEEQPPVPLDGGRDPRLTETGTLDPNQVLAGSLPYLPADEEISEPYTQTQQPPLDPYGDSGTPVPRPGQPHIDPNATMVGQSFDMDTLASQEQTLPNMRGVDATMPSPSIRDADAYQGVESVYDTPPEYEYADESQSPYYAQARAEQRSSLLRMGVIAAVFLTACGLISGIVGFLGLQAWYNGQIEPYSAAIDGLADYRPDFQTVRILDANNEVIAELSSQDGGARTPVSLNRMSPYAIHAVISTENRDFYQDPGFSFGRIVSAFIQNLQQGEIVSGASTITQQIARNLILRDSTTTASRKVSEILIANEIARRYDKNFILQLYMNEIFFGNQSYGIEEAAQFYFDKPAADLNLAESAMLAGIISAPAANDPVVNLEQALRQARNSMRLMVEAGCLQFQHGEWAQTGQPFCVTEETRIDFEGQQNAPLIRLNADGTIGGVAAFQLARDVIAQTYRPRNVEIEHPHFVNYVQALVEAEFGTGAMFQRGFTIKTTLNSRIQNAAESALRQQVNALVNNGVTTGAVMVTDPDTGAIRAMVGSPDFNNEDIAGQVDNTRTLQQPGSAIKPVVYTAALEGVGGEYLTPVSILWNVPSTYQIPGGGTYTPTNFRNNPALEGPVTVRTSLQNSLNIPAVKAFDFIGAEKFVEVAERMQLRFDERSTFGLPTALGANDVRLIDMMKAYAILANGGVYQPLYAIESITEDIDGVETVVPMPGTTREPQQIISPQLAYLMQNIMSDDNARRDEFGVNSSLTLANAGIAEVQNVVAAKTGTSNGGRDLWTMGFTDIAVVGVWLGTWDNAETRGVTGFTAASPVWNVVMRSAVEGRRVTRFNNPGGVVQETVCLDTGTIAGQDCARRASDLFLQSQPPPPAQQGVVVTIPVDSWTGLRANQWCQENVENRVFANIDDPFAIQWINQTTAGQQYAQRVGLPQPLQAPPQAECSQGMVLPSARINNPSNGQTLTETVTITGQVSAPDFNRYELEYAPVNTDQFIPIGDPVNQQFPDAGSTLGQWDTRLVNNGGYILRLAVYSNSGGVIYRTVNINIQNIPPTATPAPTPTATDAFVPPPTVIFPTADTGGGFTPLPFDEPTPTATLDF